MLRLHLGADVYSSLERAIIIIICICYLNSAIYRKIILQTRLHNGKTIPKRILQTRIRFSNSK